MEALRETHLLTKRSCELLQKEHRHLWALFTEMSIFVGEDEVPWFVAGDEGHQIAFYIYERTLSCELLGYPRHFDMYPHPDDAVIEFVSLVEDVVAERVSVLLWQTDEVEPCGDIIETGSDDFYSFLWESAEKAWVKSWKGTYDRKIR